MITEGYGVQATTTRGQTALSPTLDALFKFHVIEGQTRLIRFRDYIRAGHLSNLEIRTAGSPVIKDDSRLNQFLKTYRNQFDIVPFVSDLKYPMNHPIGSH